MLSLLLFAALCFSTGSLTNECTNYMELPKAGLRDPSVPYNITKTAVCDRDLAPGWYRAGFRDMPTIVALPNHCGTVYAYYLKGSIPSDDGQVHDMLACIGDDFDDCYDSVAIKVRNCDEYRVYHLSPFSFCSAAYCFEYNAGTVPSFKPATAEVRYKEIVWETVGSKTLPRLVFECYFQMSDDTGYSYGVKWYVNDDETKFTVAGQSDISSTDLNERELIEMGYRHGIYLKCEADARFDGNTEIAGQSTTSSLFFAGMKVKTPFLELEMADKISENAIRFEPTVPFACENSDENCTLEIKMENPNSENCEGTKIVTDSGRCNTSIPGRASTNANNYYTTDAWKEEYFFNVKPSNPTNFDLTSEFKVQLITGVVDHQFWSSGSLEDVTVNVRNLSNIWFGKYCEAYVDPHVKTFDGSYFKFGGLDMDSYLLYKNGLQEVQVSLYTCFRFNGYAYCICAVAVRAGRDVFIINICGDHTVIDYVLCEDSVLRVESDNGQTFKVIFPTGTEVVIYIIQSTSMFLQVFIYPRASDEYSTVGICGTLNDNCLDDFTLKNGTVQSVSWCYKDQTDVFTNSWRLSKDEHLFVFHQNNAKYTNLQPLNDKILLCFCPYRKLQGETERAPIYKEVAQCSYQEYTNCTTPRYKTFKCFVNNMSRRRRDLSSIRRTFINQRPERSAQVHRLEKRSTSFSSSEAREICEKTLNDSTSYQICSENVAQIDGSYLDACISDIQEANDASLANLIVEVANSVCVQLVSKNITMQNESKDVVEIIYQTTCPANCSNRGSCVEGACVCDEGFTGTDCSSDKSTAPSVTRLINDGLCDLAEGSCDEISLYGTNILNTDETKCKFSTQQILNDASVVYAGEVTLSGEQRSIFEAICNPPANTGENTFVNIHNVSLSNDGDKYSDAYVLYIYDSTCQLINNDTGTISFTLKPGYCFIDGLCVVENTMRSLTCTYCNTTQSEYNWSNITGCEIETSTSQSTTNFDTSTLPSSIAATTTQSSEASTLSTQSQEPSTTATSRSSTDSSRASETTIQSTTNLDTSTSSSTSSTQSSEASTLSTQSQEPSTTATSRSSTDSSRASETTIQSTTNLDTSTSPSTSSTQSSEASTLSTQSQEPSTTTTTRLTTGSSTASETSISQSTANLGTSTLPSSTTQTGSTQAGKSSNGSEESDNIAVIVVIAVSIVVVAAGVLATVLIYKKLKHSGVQTTTSTLNIPECAHQDAVKPVFGKGSLGSPNYSIFQSLPDVQKERPASARTISSTFDADKSGPNMSDVFSIDLSYQPDTFEPPSATQYGK